jgi:hypothetical protein
MPIFHRSAFRATAIPIVAVWLACLSSAHAEPLAPFVANRPSFTDTLSNNTPLAFGMDVEDVSRALGSPLNYISGRPGDEIFLAIRHAGGSFFFPRSDRLYLQFRRGRLTGWKGDWGERWILARH